MLNSSTSSHKSARLQQLPPTLTSETRRRLGEARTRGVDVISLGIGDPDGPTPDHVVETLTRAAADPLNHCYPEGGARGMTAFREAVASWYEKRFSVTLDPATEVIALIGSKEANHHLALGLLDPGDVALLPDPAYPTYESSVLIAGGTVVRLALPPERSFLPDLAAIPTEVLDDAKVVWFNFPNNPTGGVAPLDFWAHAVELAHRHRFVLVNDNPYSEIAFDGVRPASILQVSGAKDVAVEFASLSKTYCMTGWRIGMAVGNRDVLAAMLKVKEGTDAGIFAPVQHAGIAALEGPQDVVERNNRTYERRRDRLVETLRELGLPALPPVATFYLWVAAPPGLSGLEFSDRLLDHAGVLVTPGTAYGSQGEGFVRMSLSVSDERLEEALQRIAKVRDELVR